MKRYFQILSRVEHPARFVTARLLVKSGLCQMFEIKQQGYRLKFYPSNLSEQLWIDPTRRESALAFFRSYVRPGDFVVDVGSNIGDTAILCAQLAGTDGQIWAIEPHPRTFNYLLGNIALNGNKSIHPLNVAVGETPGEVSFGDGRRDDMNQVGDHGIRVPIARLDDIIPPGNEIALLKIDVEGYELPALRGAEQLLRRTRCIYFEVSEAMATKFGYRISDLLGFLTGQGFLLYRQDSLGNVMKVEDNFATDDVENLLGVKDPREFVARTSWRMPTLEEAPL